MWRKELVKIALQDFAGRSFGGSLRTTAAGVMMEQPRQERGRSVVFKYTVPEPLCHRTTTAKETAKERSVANHCHAPAGPTMGVGAVLAVFDELSTYALMLQDAKARPGVSVHLSAELLSDVPAHSTVLIESCALKVGRSLGFCEVEMRDSDGQLVARGRHVKYLPMGRLWEVLASPWLLPHVVKGYSRLVAAREQGGGVMGWLAQAVLGEKKTQPPLLSDTTGAVYKSLALRPPEHKSEQQQEEEEASDEPAAEWSTLSRAPRYYLPNAASLSNLGGSLHGGAVAMAAELAARHQGKAMLATGRRMSAMEVHYLSAIKGRQNVFITAQHSAATSSTIGQVRQQQPLHKPAQSSVMATFQCRWQ
mmetsp:Transcript_27574/g.46624  ORF Transcript_27574/g.46624 Transcript_27574/m.46624 type:complete len:364 (+) Transcript_27574:249-1340(+)